MTERIARKLSLERIPRQHRALAAEAIEAEAARERAEDAARRAAIEKAMEQHGRSLRELASDKALRAMDEASRAERRALRALREAGAKAGDLAQAAGLGRKRLARVAGGLGIDAVRLRKLAAARSRRLERAAAPPASWTTGRLLEGKPGSRWFRPPVDPPDRVVTPPFLFGLDYRGSYVSDGFTVGLDWEIDESTGRVATRTWMRCPDASWWNDFASVWVEADLVFVYTAPTTGRLSVLVDATNLASSSRLRLEDEFGFSESETHLRNFLTLRVYHPATPGVSSVEMNHFTRTGTDGVFPETARYPGTRSYAALESPGTVQAGDTFYVAVGTRNYDWCSTDDVEVESRADWGWVINALDIGMLASGPIVPVVGGPLAAARRGRRRAASR